MHYLVKQVKIKKKNVSSHDLNYSCNTPVRSQMKRGRANMIRYRWCPAFACSLLSCSLSSFSSCNKQVNWMPFSMTLKQSQPVTLQLNMKLRKRCMKTSLIIITNPTIHSNKKSLTGNQQETCTLRGWP